MNDSDAVCYRCGVDHEGLICGEAHPTWEARKIVALVRGNNPMKFTPGQILDQIHYKLPGVAWELAGESTVRREVYESRLIWAIAKELESMIEQCEARLKKEGKR